LFYIYVSIKLQLASSSGMREHVLSDFKLENSETMFTDCRVIWIIHFGGMLWCPCSLLSKQRSIYYIATV